MAGDHLLTPGISHAHEESGPPPDAERHVPPEFDTTTRVRVRDYAFALSVSAFLDVFWGRPNSLCGGTAVVVLLLGPA